MVEFQALAAVQPVLVGMYFVGLNCKQPLTFYFFYTLQELFLRRSQAQLGIITNIEGFQLAQLTDFGWQAGQLVAVKPEFPQLL